MNRIRTSWAILKSSLELMGKNKKLAWFPLLNFFAIVGIVVFFAMPVFLEMNVFNFMEKFPKFMEAMGENAPDNSGGEPSFIESGFWSITINERIIPTFYLLVFYLASMVLATFVNVAFYYEIMQAFNGKQVSISRGFGFAATKIKAILVWSMLAGVVGAIIHQIEENVGFVGKWITGLIGIAWSVASVFAIPVIIREEQQGNPADYLKKSASLIKQTWGEGLAGVVGITLIVWLLIMGTLFGGILMMLTIPFPGTWMIFFTLFMPSLFVLLYLAGVARKIFLCGLYVYASEGVVPGAFNAEIFDNAWKVKKSKK